MVWAKSRRGKSGMGQKLSGPKVDEPKVDGPKVVIVDAIEWRGDTSLPAEKQGVTVLGAPLGHPAYVRRS